MEVLEIKVLKEIIENVQERQKSNRKKYNKEKRGKEWELPLLSSLNEWVPLSLARPSPHTKMYLW